VSTRRLRIVKYRGTVHGTNEYPFMIDKDGISVLPITSLALEHEAVSQRISTGVADLDGMLGGKGYFRGSTVLVSGTAGTGKTSVAAHFAEAACRRREKCLYFAFEESPTQLARNMRSIGLDLGPCLRKGLLRVHSMRSTLQGLETHLTMFHSMVDKFRPRVVVFDPIDSLIQAGTPRDATAMLTRLIDFLKVRGVTVLMTNLIHDGARIESGIDISSLVDTWLLLQAVELSGERNRAFSVIKSRGMKHSSQIREFLITDRGIKLQEVCRGPEGVLTGWAREAAEDRRSPPAGPAGGRRRAAAHKRTGGGP
jgi:circadian clock protein KaiC